LFKNSMEALAWVRDGDYEELKKWLSEVNIQSSIEEEDIIAAQRRSIVFGQGMFMLDMSLLLWTVDTPDIDNTKRIKLSDVLLSFYPSLINHPGPERATPLHYASGNGNSKLVLYLLDKGAKITYDDKNESPLHWASLNGWGEVAKLLLQANANPNDISVDKKTPIQYAILNKHIEVVAILLSDSRLNSTSRKEATTLASQLGQPEIIQLFDPEKREMIMMSQSQQKTIEELKERILFYDQRREMDIRAIEIASQKLAVEREFHKKSMEMLEQLQNEYQTRTEYEQEAHWAELYKSCTELTRKNEELTKSLQTTTINNEKQIDPQVITQLQPTVSTITNVLSLFKAAHMALDNAQLELETLSRYLPKGELTTTQSENLSTLNNIPYSELSNIHNPEQSLDNMDVFPN